MAESDWSYPTVPRSQRDLEVMMQDLDKFLATKNLEPGQRPMHATLHVARLYDYEGPLFRPITSGGPGAFDGAWAIQAMTDWYEANYGDRLKMEMGPGFVVIELRGTLWRMRLPRVFGHVQFFMDTNLANEGKRIAKLSDGQPASVNLIRSIDGITSAFAASLSGQEQIHVMESFIPGFSALMRLEKLKGDDLFDRARADYEASIEALVVSSWHNARWDTAQCAEKVLKGILRQRGRAFPTDGKRGHDIVVLGGLVRDETGAKLADEALRLVHCPTRLRYGEETADQQRAMRAHRALLGILRWLKD